MRIFALGMSKRIDVSLPVVRQREDIKAAWGAHSTLGGLSYLGFQPLFLPQSTNKNRSGTDPDRSACYAGLGAFTRRDDAPFSPPRPYWFDAKLGATAILSSISTRREREREVLP